MVTQFAASRQTLPFSFSNVVITNDGNLSVTGNYYLSIQAQNRVGLSLNSTPFLITLTSTSKLTIILPTLLTSESEVQNLIISASLTNDVTTLTQIVSVNKADFNTPLILNSPDIFKLTTTDRTVANPSNLPVTPDQGLIKYITSLNFYYCYDKYSTLTVDNIQVLSANNGRWIRIGSINTYQSNTTIAGGCDQDVRTPNLTVNAPTYTCDGSKGTGVIFWIRNDYNYAIPSGTRISGTVRLFEEDRSQLFEGLLIFEILGYVNLTAFSLDTTVSTGEIAYSAQDFLNLTEDLPSGSAVAVRVSPKFRPEFLDGIIPYLGNLTTYLTFSANTGVYAPGSAAYGNVIYAEYDQFKIVPWNGLSVKRLKGSGVIDNYELIGISEEIITGLIANTPNQYIFLTSNGTTFASTNSAITGALVRAKVSTVDGINNPINYGNINLDNTKQLQITVNYPTTIRSDYPDTELVGLSNGYFNASYVEIYLKKNSDNTYYVSEQLITPNSSNQIFTLTFSNFSSVTSLPTNDANFGLYNLSSVSLLSVTNTSTFTTDTYTVYIAFKYLNSVTEIDSTVSDFTVANTSFSDIIKSNNSWGSYLNTLTDARALTTAQLINGQSRFIFESFAVYVFNYSETRADNGSTIIKPTVLGNNPGAFTYNKSNNILINSGIPNNNLGNLNDIYLDVVSGIIYLKTTINNWTSEGTLRSNFINGNTSPSNSIGNNGDIYINNTTGDLSIKSDNTWTVTANLKGNKGQGAYTTTTAAFTQPNTNSTVTIEVTNSDWMAVGQYLFLTNAGHYQVSAIPNSTSVTLTNLGYTSNISSGSNIATAQSVTADGLIGVQGIQGNTPTIGVGTVTSVSPTTNASVTTTATSTGVNLNFNIPQGQTGIKGDTGSPPVLQEGTTTTLAPGSNATVTLTAVQGQNGTYEFDFGIPQGANSDTTPTLVAGTITTLSPGSQATASVTQVTSGGNPNTYQINLGIPQGQSGTGGSSNTWVVKNANYTAQSGDLIIADTSQSSFLLTLPQSPIIGDEITIVKNNNNNSLSISGNTNKIKGYSYNTYSYIDLQELFKLIYVNSIAGWLPVPDALYQVITTCTYVSDGDANGIFYYLGLNGGSTWSNPYPNYLQINSIDIASGMLASLTDRQPSDFYTSNNANRWIEFDLKIYQLKLSYFSYRARNSSDTTYNPNSLIVSGSNDGVNYINLQTISISPTTQNSWFSTSLVSPSVYRIYRFTQPASSYFTAGEFELYGTLLTKI